jgi:hypothetical protein
MRDSGTITRAVHQAMQDATDFLNRRLFGGALPDSFSHSKGGRTRRDTSRPAVSSSAATSPAKSGMGSILNPDSFINEADKAIASTLAHEIAHLWRYVVVVGRERRDRRAEVKTAVEELRRDVADRLVSLREKIADAVVSKPVTDDTRIDRAVETIATKLTSTFTDALDKQRRSFEGKIADLEMRLKNTGPRLPPVKPLVVGSVVYENEVRVFGGSLWQAARDTGGSPPSADWRLIAAAGEAGRPGKSLAFRGPFDVHSPP